MHISRRLILAALLYAWATSTYGACIRDQPKISIIGATRDPNTGRHVKSYGEDIILHCFSEDAIKMKKDDKLQNIRVLNKTTVELFEGKLDIGVYKYSCSTENCEDTLFVIVKPAMYVHSKLVQRQFDEDYGVLMNFVQIGSYYEVFCTGNNVEDLRILLNNNDRIPLQTEMVNKTTVKCTERADKELDKAYFCKSKTNGKDLQEMTVVTAGYFPDGRDFRCTIYDTRVLECSWIYYTSGDISNLYYKDHDRTEDAVLLCSDHFSRRTSTCRVNEYFSRRRLFYMNHNVSFILNTCNLFVCNNQTFTMNTNTITQLSPLKCKEPRGTILVWENDCEKCDYRVLFRLLDFGGNRLQKLNTSVRCDYKNCEFELLLPYPDKKYEVLLKAKHKEALSEKLWSKPCLVIVTTAPRAKCACNTPSELILTEKASCEACTLIEDTIEKSLVLKNRILSLKEKLDKINMLSMLLSRSREISDRIKDLG